MTAGHKDKKKTHAIAATSKEAYRRLLKTKTFESERFIIFEAIQAIQPVTSRALRQYTGIPRTNITRTIRQLILSDHPQIKIAFKKKCTETKVTVNWYSLLSWKDGTINFKQ